MSPEEATLMLWQGFFDGIKEGPSGLSTEVLTLWDPNMQTRHSRIQGTDFNLELEIAVLDSPGEFLGIPKLKMSGSGFNLISELDAGKGFEELENHMKKTAAHVLVLGKVIFGE